MITVLIAVDGTEESHHAARRAKELFGDKAHYLVVSVAEPVPPVMTPAPVETVLPPDPDVVAAITDQAEAEAQEAALEDMQSVDSEVLVGEGDPVGVLCATAERRNVDVIVVGSHERSWFSRLLDPSVRDRLVRSAPCSVLVVRMPKAKDDSGKH